MFGWFKKRESQPETAQEEQPKQKRVYVRNYNAGKTDLLTESWGVQPIPVNQSIQRNLAAMRARSREQANNNDYVKRFVKAVRSNVVGPKGVILQADVRNNNGTRDPLASQAIEEAWLDWCRRKHCDVAGEVSFQDIQRLVMSSMAIDGEFLARKVQGRSAGKYGYQLQLLDPELLDVNYSEDLKNGNYIYMSIEYSSYGKPIAYHLIDRETENGINDQYKRKRARVPSEQIFHLFIPDLIQQKRGVPWTASALNRLKNLNGYEHAAVVAARVGASKMGFFTRSEEAGQYTGEEQEDGSLVTDADPGTFEILPDGYNFTSFNPDYPHNQYGEFTKACLRGAASGLGISYNTLANDLEGVNFSSIRAGVLEDREMWKELQEFLIDAFLVDVYEDWLRMALLTSNIKVKGKPLNITRFDRYNKPRFQPRRWAWVDPLKDSKANESLIAMNAASTSEIIRDRGRDPEQVYSEIARDKEMMESAGIEPKEVKPNAGNTGEDTSGDANANAED
jgi:lambda family phage portal protein